jgi:hypothetical protein
MFSVISNIYNKKTKGPTLLELFNVSVIFSDYLQGGVLRRMYRVFNNVLRDYKHL